MWEGEIESAEQWLRRSIAYDTDPSQSTIYAVERFWAAARLATAQQQYQRAATLFGLADKVHSRINSGIAGPPRARADAALVTVRAALDPVSFAEAFAVGQRLSFAEAFATILAPVQIAPPCGDSHG